MTFESSETTAEIGTASFVLKTAAMTVMLPMTGGSKSTTWPVNDMFMALSSGSLENRITLAPETFLGSEVSSIASNAKELFADKLINSEEVV